MAGAASRQPAVVLFTGPPGTGKSTLAQHAAATLGASALGWDWAMAGLGWCDPVQQALRQLDGPDYRRIGWSILGNLAESELRAGRSVVLDGVARDAEIAMVRDVAARSGARAVVLLTECRDDDVLRQRIAVRRRGIPGWHELTWDDVSGFLSRWTRPADVDGVVDTTSGPAPDEALSGLLPATGEGAAARSARPETVASLTAALAELGPLAGETVLVHSSLSRLGWVAGGAQAVVEALLAAAGGEGTVVVPTHSGHLSDPARWRRPPVPEAWWDVIRRETPAFDARLTPTRGMGAVVECFRRLPDAVRSPHPTLSFTAVGPNATGIVERHALAHGLGEESPLARLYDLDALVLLLGVGHANNTSLHLAEYRADFAGKEHFTQGSPILVEGERRWVSYDDMEPDDSDFALLGDDLAAAGLQRTGPVGSATALLMRQREAVDFAVAWFERHRPARRRGPG